MASPRRNMPKLNATKVSSHATLMIPKNWKEYYFAEHFIKRVMNPNNEPLRATRRFSELLVTRARLVKDFVMLVLRISRLKNDDFYYW